MQSENRLQAEWLLVAQRIAKSELHRYKTSWAGALLQTVSPLLLLQRRTPPRNF
jgi:hypothetical protein